MSRGTILNATPFTVPVWVGAASLTGTNTELTGPSGVSLANRVMLEAVGIPWHELPAESTPDGPMLSLERLQRTVLRLLPG